ncbi:hypothetical protein DIPPA_22531 [Diplonema papillatum]|nr:hypothetical protein DIPPA_22531 [Diplonema papillatum]
MVVDEPGDAAGVAAAVATVAVLLASGVLWWWLRRSPFPAGTRVRLHRLLKRADLNGAYGVVRGAAGDGGNRIAVCLDDGTSISVRKENAGKDIPDTTRPLEEVARYIRAASDGWLELVCPNTRDDPPPVLKVAAPVPAGTCVLRGHMLAFDAGATFADQAAAVYLNPFARACVAGHGLPAPEAAGSEGGGGDGRRRGQAAREWVAAAAELLPARGLLCDGRRGFTTFSAFCARTPDAARGPEQSSGPNCLVVLKQDGPREGGIVDPLLPPLAAEQPVCHVVALRDLAAGEGVVLPNTDRHAWRDCDTRTPFEGSEAACAQRQAAERKRRRAVAYRQWEPDEAAAALRVASDRKCTVLAACSASAACRSARRTAHTGAPPPGGSATKTPSVACRNACTGSGPDEALSPAFSAPENQSVACRNASTGSGPDEALSPAFSAPENQSVACKPETPSVACRNANTGSGTDEASAPGGSAPENDSLSAIRCAECGAAAAGGKALPLGLEDWLSDIARDHARAPAKYSLTHTVGCLKYCFDALGPLHWTCPCLAAVLVEHYTTGAGCNAGLSEYEATRVLRLLEYLQRWADHQLPAGDDRGRTRAERLVAEVPGLPFGLALRGNAANVLRLLRGRPEALRRAVSLVRDLVPAAFTFHWPADACELYGGGAPSGRGPAPDPGGACWWAGGFSAVFGELKADGTRVNAVQAKLAQAFQSFTDPLSDPYSTQQQSMDTHVDTLLHALGHDRDEASGEHDTQAYMSLLSKLNFGDDYEDRCKEAEQAKAAALHTRAPQVITTI